MGKDRKYTPPGLGSFRSSEDLLRHFANKGDPKAFAEAQKFVRECDTILRNEAADKSQKRFATRAR